MLKTAILQPIIPHYREAFFKGLKKDFDIDIFCYENKSKAQKKNFKVSNLKEKDIKNVAYGPWLFYNPFLLLSKKYGHLILMWHFGHLSTWFLLITKFIHKKKITVWGQGISVKRYLQEEKKVSLLLKKMASMADTIWVYTEKEKKQWEKIFPYKEIVALNNTISGIEKIIEYKADKSEKQLKNENNITQQICFIFCARFNNPYRRVDLLVEAIQKFNNQKYGFIIIGDGEHKPDFAQYSNVYDFGSVYNNDVKNDLFTIANFYFQPGWVGLSVVEALAYGKPVITFKRSEDTLQCVEYAYLNNHNAIIVNSVDEMENKINKLTATELQEYSKNAKAYVNKNLSMKNMITNAVSSLNTIKL